MKSRPLLAILALAACTAAPKPAPTPPAQPAPVPVQAPTPAPDPDPAPAPNRDAHGNPDVARYIEVLQSGERVADLQIERVVSLLALPRDAVIGDLGCGPGLFAVAFAEACPDGVVYASDIEPRQLDEVRERIHASKLRNVVPVLASVDDPHFPPARLDVVFVGDTYHHLDDRVAYMIRLKSVLRPGGRIVLLEYKPGKLPVGPPPEHKLQAGVLERELGEAGFERVASYDTHPYHDFQVWRPR